MKNNVYHLILFFGLFLIFQFSDIRAQKIFPGAMGFGTESRGAYEGISEPTILIVDTLFAGLLQTSTYSGSFEWCVTRDYPRIILFSVGGVIDYSNTNVRYINIRHPYMNVYGQTAPSPGITIISCNLYVEASDMLFQHLIVRYGDKPMANGDHAVGDCLTILKNGENVVVDHCSFSWSQDELIGTYGNNSTFSNNLMYEPLNYSNHADEGGVHNPEIHGFGPLVSVKGSFTFMRNFLGWTIGRNPHLVTNTFVNLNNYVYSYALLGPDVSGSNGAVNGCMVGNVNMPTNGQNEDKAEYSTYLRESVPWSSKIFFNDNLCIRKQNGYLERDNIFTYSSPSLLNKIIVNDESDAYIDLCQYEILPSSDVENYILKYAGARYWDRDYYDKMAMQKFTNRQQDFINSPDPLPARAYNASSTEGWHTRAGNMENGYNFRNNPIKFTVNGSPITLNSNYSSQAQILEALNNQMPSGTVAVDHPHQLSYHIILQTLLAGSSASITVEGDDLRVFGIYPGTYFGSDGVGGYPNYATTHAMLNIPTNPHGDDNGNGYTNIEEWVYNMPISMNPCDNLSCIEVVTNTVENHNDGAININVSGGSGPYSFTWNDGSIEQNRTGLSEGIYTVTILDNAGCTLYKSIRVCKASILINYIDVSEGIIITYYTLSGDCSSVNAVLYNQAGVEIYSQNDVESGFRINVPKICNECNDGKYKLVLTCESNKTERIFDYYVPQSLKILNYIPNPTSGIVTINFYSPIVADIDGIIYNGIGKKLKQDYYSVREGLNQIVINMSDLPQGNYTIALGKDSYTDSCIVIKL